MAAHRVGPFSRRLLDWRQGQPGRESSARDVRAGAGPGLDPASRESRMAPPETVTRRQQVQTKFGELLMRNGKIDQAQLQEGLAYQKEQGGRLGVALVKLGHLTERQLVEALSQHFGVPAVDLAATDIDEAVIKIIPADIARKYTIVPVSKAGATVTVAMLDHSNVYAMDDVKFKTGYKVEPVVAAESGIRGAIDHYYGSTHAIELKKVMEDLSEEAAAGTDLEV